MSVTEAHLGENMLGAIAILLIAFWFYKTAERLRLPALAWVVGGVIVYYTGFAAWMYLLLRPMLGERFQSHGLGLGLAMDISSVLLGAVLAAIFKAKVMEKRGRQARETPF